MKNIELSSQKYKFNLKKSIIFEFRILVGKFFLKSLPDLRKYEKARLHLGCASIKFEDWINADIYSFLSRNKPDWNVDLRNPLNCNDNIWDGVFTEHTIEHLYADKVEKLFLELFRTMKPGAWIRITVPDLKKYVNYYTGEKAHNDFKRWRTGCEAIRTLTQDNFHLSVWDAELLTQYLSEAGFIKIREVSYMEGTDISLLKDKEERSWETLYMEAQKPVN